MFTLLVYCTPSETLTWENAHHKAEGKKQQEKALPPRTREQLMQCKAKEEILSFFKETETNIHKCLYNLSLKNKISWHGSGGRLLYT